MRVKHGLDATFQPRSVASTDASKPGGRPASFLYLYGFAGAVLPVNPRAGEVQGNAVYPLVAALPEVSDFTIFALTAGAVQDATAGCAARGVRAPMVFSSGFSERGEVGEALQHRVPAIAAKIGIRVLEPNCPGAATPPSRDPLLARKAGHGAVALDVLIVPAGASEGAAHGS